MGNVSDKTIEQLAEEKVVEKAEKVGIPPIPPKAGLNKGELLAKLDALTEEQWELVMTGLKELLELANPTKPTT